MDEKTKQLWAKNEERKNKLPEDFQEFIYYKQTILKRYTAVTKAHFINLCEDAYTLAEAVRCTHPLNLYDDNFFKEIVDPNEEKIYSSAPNTVKIIRDLADRHNKGVPLFERS